jgi:YD repeat-containing protein
VLAAAIAIMVTAIVVTPAAAQATQNFYDASGKKIGSSTTYGNTTNFYDDRGRKLESSTRTGNTTTIYNDRGSHIGTTTATGRK